MRQRLTPQLLLSAYCQGVFPMAPSRHSDVIEFYAADPRAVLPLDGLVVHHTVKQKIRRRVFEIRHDTAFEQVIRSCSQPRRGHPDTWINQEIVAAYTELHEMGFAHSIEAWRDGELVGGLYGVAIGGLFAGESMFHVPGRGTDASKVCLVHLVEHLKTRGFSLLDVQTQSDHMASLGTIEVPRSVYMEMLGEAIEREVTWSDGAT
jgi:leucyl/phenylalanyl-tRNA--protein transferase